MKKFCFILLTVTTFSCTQLEDKEISAVRNVVEGIILADNRGDIDAVVAYYDSHATLMPPGKPEINGESAIRKNYEKIFSATSLHLRAKIESVDFENDLALCKGRTEGKVVSKMDSTSSEVDDKFLMVLTRKTGEWKIIYLMWSMDK
jgi:ketosteroid isomerase-like protein